MKVPALTHHFRLCILRWIARILAVGLFLFFGAFFLEHLQEWFITPKQFPPFSVCIRMLFHFFLLLGYVLALRWERIGSLVVVVSAFTFLASILGWNFYKFFLIAVLPALLFLYLHSPLALPRICDKAAS